MFSLAFLKPTYLGAESYSGGDTPASGSNSQSKLPSKNLHTSSASLLYPVVNKEVEQQFLGGAGHCNKRHLCSYFSKVNHSGNAAVLHFASHSLLQHTEHNCAYVEFS
jgi:hypothetical protein